MPSTSAKQHRFMEAVAHDPKFAKRAGVSQSVGSDFAAADAGRKFKAGGPTEAQKAAGNYAKDHKRVLGMRVSIENKAGSIRSGKDHEGREWKQKMAHDYGYIRGATGKDKDHLDVFLGPRDPAAHPAHVVDQLDHRGNFDEHKVVLGAANPQEASEVYHANYEPGWRGFGDVTAMDHGMFKKWAFDKGRRIKPAAEHSVAKRAYADGGRVTGRTLAELAAQAARFPLSSSFDSSVGPAGGRPVVAYNPSPSAVGGYDVGHGYAPSMGGLSALPALSPFGPMILPHPDLPSAAAVPDPTAGAPVAAPDALLGSGGGDGPGPGTDGSPGAASGLGNGADSTDGASAAAAAAAADAADAGMGGPAATAADAAGSDNGASSDAGNGNGDGSSGDSGSGDGGGGDGGGEKRGGLIRRRYADGGAVDESKPAFVYPGMGKRRFNDREASSNMPAFAARGLLTGALGLPDSILTAPGGLEALGRALINRKGGNVSPDPILPTSSPFPSEEQISDALPMKPQMPADRFAQGAGAFVGNAAAQGPLNAGLRQLPGALSRVMSKPGAPWAAPRVSGDVVGSLERLGSSPGKPVSDWHMPSIDGWDLPDHSIHYGVPRSQMGGINFGKGPKPVDEKVDVGRRKLFGLPEELTPADTGTANLPAVQGQGALSQIDDEMRQAAAKQAGQEGGPGLFERLINTPFTRRAVKKQAASTTLRHNLPDMTGMAPDATDAAPVVQAAQSLPPFDAYTSNLASALGLPVKKIVSMLANPHFGQGAPVGGVGLRDAVGHWGGDVEAIRKAVGWPEKLSEFNGEPDHWNRLHPDQARQYIEAAKNLTPEQMAEINKGNFYEGQRIWPDLTPDHIANGLKRGIQKYDAHVRGTELRQRLEDAQSNISSDFDHHEAMENIARSVMKKKPTNGYASGGPVGGLYDSDIGQGALAQASALARQQQQQTTSSGGGSSNGGDHFGSMIGGIAGSFLPFPGGSMLGSFLGSLFD